MSKTLGPFAMPNPYSILYQFDEWWRWESDRIFRGVGYEYSFTIIATP